MPLITRDVFSRSSSSLLSRVTLLPMQKERQTRLIPFNIREKKFEYEKRADKVRWNISAEIACQEESEPRHKTVNGTKNVEATKKGAYASCTSRLSSPRPVAVVEKFATLIKVKLGRAMTCATARTLWCRQTGKFPRNLSPRSRLGGARITINCTKTLHSCIEYEPRRWSRCMIKAEHSFTRPLLHKSSSTETSFSIPILNIKCNLLRRLKKGHRATEPRFGNRCCSLSMFVRKEMQRSVVARDTWEVRELKARRDD